MNVPVEFGDSSSNGPRDMQQQSGRMWHFRPFLYFDNCQPEVVSDVISGTADQMSVLMYRPILTILV